MSRLLLLVLLCRVSCQFATAKSEKQAEAEINPLKATTLKLSLETSPYNTPVPFWHQRNKVDVTLIAEEIGLNEEDIRENFQDLFDEYGKRYSRSFNKRNLKSMVFDSKNKPPIAKYQAYGIDCNQFLNFLQTRSPMTYRLKFVHVKCDRISFSICMSFECPESNFNSMERYANNRTN